MSLALPDHQGAWALLYQLSMERAHRPAFMPVLPLVYSHLLGAPSLGNAPELVALAVNLTQDGQLAEARAGIPFASMVTRVAACMIARPRHQARGCIRSWATARTGFQRSWAGPCPPGTPWHSSSCATLPPTEALLWPLCSRPTWMSWPPYSRSACAPVLHV